MRILAHFISLIYVKELDSDELTACETKALEIADCIPNHSSWPKIYKPDGWRLVSENAATYGAILDNPYVKSDQETIKKIDPGGDCGLRIEGSMKTSISSFRICSNRLVREVFKTHFP